MLPIVCVFKKVKMRNYIFFCMDINKHCKDIKKPLKNIYIREKSKVNETGMEVQLFCITYLHSFVF